MSFMLASGHFYTSGLFWGVVGALIGLAALLVTVIIWRFGAPWRVLIYGMPVSTSLLTRSSGGFGLASSGLKMRYKRRALSDPHVVTLSVNSQSRRDIGSADFDQNRPLVFDVGAPIRAVVGDGPIGPAADVVSISGSTVQLKPMLIHQGLVLQIDLLIDGPPRLSCQDHLIDVKVRERTPEDAQRRRIRIQSITLVVALIALLIALTPYVIVTIHNLNSPAVTISEPTNGSVAPSNVLNVAGTAHNIPSNDDLWLVVRSVPTGLWYPSARLLVRGGEWKTQITGIRAPDGPQQLFVIMLPVLHEGPFLRYLIASARPGRPPQALSALPAGSQSQAVVQIRVRSN